MQTTDNYHHGDLRDSLIKTGLKLYTEEGEDKFSMRKVAAMCNVSHAAPYKHFKNKEELINAISEYIFRDFSSHLNKVMKKYKGNPNKKIIELCKQYISFVVKNPHYLKFRFASNFKYKIIIEGNEFKVGQQDVFNVFKDCAIDFLKNADVQQGEYTKDIISMWSIVQGLAIMLSSGMIVYKGDYLELVEKILNDNFKFN